MKFRPGTPGKPMSIKEGKRVSDAIRRGKHVANDQAIQTLSAVLESRLRAEGICESEIRSRIDRFVRRAKATQYKNGV